MEIKVHCMKHEEALEVKDVWLAIGDVLHIAVETCPRCLPGPSLQKLMVLARDASERGQTRR